MKISIRARVLGIYDLFLGIGAIWIGALMLQSNSGVFAEYPENWATKLPFNSWFMIGVLVILIFGLGNIIAAVLSFKKRTSSWFVSSFMGIIFLISISVHRMIIEETYIITNPFIALSVIQLVLSGLLFLGYRKKQILTEID